MSDLCGMWGPPNGWLCREPKGHDGRHVWRPSPEQMDQPIPGTVDMEGRPGPTVWGGAADVEAGVHFIRKENGDICYTNITAIGGTYNRKNTVVTYNDPGVMIGEPQPRQPTPKPNEGVWFNDGDTVIVKDSHMTEHPAKSLADYGRQYDESRDQTLSQIRDGKVSASISGIEYKMHPWADLSDKEQAEWANATRIHEDRQANLPDLVLKLAVETQNSILFDAARELRQHRSAIKA